MNPKDSTCCTPGCENKARFWSCDICCRPVCGQHHVYIASEYLEKPPLLKEAIEQHVTHICPTCLATAELKEIEDTPDDELPLLINREFLTYQAYNYYISRITGEKRDPHIFDEIMTVVKNLAKQIIEDEEHRRKRNKEKNKKYRKSKNNLTNL